MALKGAGNTKQQVNNIEVYQMVSGLEHDTVYTALRMDFSFP